MKVNTLKSPPVNQNGYHKNSLTKERIGTLFIYPIDYTPDDCLSCDGYSLQITDFEDLYKVIGTKFNKSGDATGTFRVPDYNVTKRFLQPGSGAGTQVAAGLPKHTHSGTLSTAGAHTHTRGTMDITGHFVTSGYNRSAAGAFYLTDSAACSISGSASSHTYGTVGFQAALAWSGATSSNGNHTHIISITEASDTLYGTTSTVQPLSQIVHICIKYK